MIICYEWVPYMAMVVYNVHARAQSWVDERQPRSSTLSAHSNRHLTERLVVLDVCLVPPLVRPNHLLFAHNLAC